MRFKSGWMLVGMVAIALGPASARVEMADTSSKRVEAAATQTVPKVAAPAKAAASVATAAQTPVYAAASGFDAYKAYLAQLARSQRISEATIRANVPGLDLNARAMELDRAQRPTGRSSGIPPMAPYIREHVTPSLIARGQSRYASHWPHLSGIYARYGVDPAVLMAIYGKETSYGAVTGGFDLLEVLASLAYEGRRRQLFESEFIAALKLLDSGMSRSRLEGSYAGATGYPQFMPSVVLRLRADGDGDGYADIWNNEVDALASIANYLRDAGWKPGVLWGVTARVPATLNRAAIQSNLNPTRCPAVFNRHSRWMTVGEWRMLGVHPVGGTLALNEMAMLMEPDGPGRTAYLLTSNYRAILEYNCSNFYAMSVGLLSDRIARR